jgi:hypothetical protein
MRIELPNGFIDGLDLFNFCEIDELRGKQQNYLADQKLVVNNIGHVSKILGDVVLSFQTKEGLNWKGDIKNEGIWKLPSSDIDTILIRLRENTYGPRFYHEAMCSHCGHHHKQLRLNLDELEIKPISMEERMASKTVNLPKSQKKIELKPLYLKDMYEMLKISTDKQDKLITDSIKLAVKTIDLKEPTHEDIENLPTSDLVYLNEQVDHIKLEGTIDTDIEITCEECKKDFKVKLNPLRSDFFSHGGGSMSLNI